MKITYFVHGRGRGHSSRAISVVARLREAGYEVDVYAGRDAFEVLKALPKVAPIDSVLPNSSPLLFFRRILGDIKRLNSSGADVIISDGDAPCTYAARWLGKHVISIGHALIFRYCNHPFSLAGTGYRLEKFKVAMATGMANFKVAVHFTAIRPKSADTVMAKPDFDVASGCATKNYLISYFRDGNGLDVLSQLDSKVLNFGLPVKLPNVENYGLDNEVFKKKLKTAKGVVASAGSNLIFESVALRKPMLLVYKKDDFEQRINAEYVEYENLGFGMPVEALDNEKIDRFIQMLKHGVEASGTYQQLPTVSEVLINYLASLSLT